MKVKPKRSYCNYLLPYKLSPACRPKIAIITKENLQPEKMEEKQGEDIAYNNNIYVFHPGMVPPSRQMFYQVCSDVTLARVFCLVNVMP
jgi:general transcription factor 3C polypeptide 5 (transcription factor C subunit 1)